MCFRVHHRKTAVFAVYYKSNDYNICPKGVEQMLEKVQAGLDELQQRTSGPEPEIETQQKFGTFAGVFTPTLLTILGAIMYLRLGQVVGNAGLLGAVLIIVLAHVITITTALSVSSISTNTRVGAGGAFAIISKALGLEVGGAVGVPLFLAQGISVSLYVLAFGEGWLRIFPTHSYFLVCLIAFLLVFAHRLRQHQFRLSHPVYHPGHCRPFPLFYCAGQLPHCRPGGVDRNAGPVGRFCPVGFLGHVCHLLPGRHRHHGRHQHERLAGQTA
jgi:hypothetical protein